MSKELTPLEALIMLQPLFIKYLLFQENYNVIETALKENEMLKQRFHELDDKCCEIILRNEKKLKALEIIKEKPYGITHIRTYKTYEEYNFSNPTGKYHLTEEEYDLLKEVLL